VKKVAAKDEKPPDILKFFIVVMAFLTLVIAGMSGVYWSRVTNLKRKIGAEERVFREIQDLSLDEKFRTLIKVAREAKKKVRPLEELDASLSREAQRYGLTIKLIPSPLLDRRTYWEKSTLIDIPGVELRRLVDYIFEVQNQWPALKIKEIRISGFNPEKGWKAQVRVSYYSLKG
jgi:hypothetical protein